MSEFDAIMAEADNEIFAVLGDDAVLVHPDVANYDVKAAVDRDVEKVFDGQIMLIDYVVTLQKPPRGVESGWKLQIGPYTFTLRELLDKDGFVSSWQATRTATG